MNAKPQSVAGQLLFYSASDSSKLTSFIRTSDHFFLSQLHNFSSHSWTEDTKLPLLKRGIGGFLPDPPILKDHGELYAGKLLSP